MKPSTKQTNQRVSMDLNRKVTKVQNEQVQLDCNYTNNYYGDQLCIASSTKIKA